MVRDGQPSRSHRVSVLLRHRSNGDVLMNPVNERIGRHASKAHRKLVLQRCEELSMGLREQLIASISAEERVDQAIHGLFMAIAELDTCRMRNDTADLVLRDHGEIEGAFLMLRDLNSDIHASVYKRAAE